MNSYQKWVLMGVCAASLSTACADQPNSKSQNSKAQMSRSDNAARCEITPSAAPVATEGARFFFTGDFIFWQAKEDNLVVAQTGEEEGRGTLTHYGKFQNIDFAYEPGFKFGAGLVFAHDGWDTFVNYTWLDETDQTASLEYNDGVNGDLYSALSDSHADRFDGSWNFYFNEIDWELGRKFFISKRLVLRPHFGLKGAWMHQNFDIVGTGIDHEVGHTNAFLQKQKFWGVGFRGGLNTEWHFTKDFSLYGNLALSTIYGLSYTKFKHTDHDPLEPVVDSTRLLQTNNIHTLRPVLELGMGFRYEMPFGEDDYYRFLVQAGWEQQIWWNQNEFLNLAADNAGNDLMFQGLDFKVGFMF